jgi:hypothetical protein
MCGSEGDLFSFSNTLTSSIIDTYCSAPGGLSGIHRFHSLFQDVVPFLYGLFTISTVYICTLHRDKHVLQHFLEYNNTMGSVDSSRFRFIDGPWASVISGKQNAMRGRENGF